ncbi:MAG: alginate export family protein, partial [Bacteroidales bacterium]
MKRNYFVMMMLATALMLAGSEMAAQSQIGIGAELRPRLEIRDGYQKIAEDGAVPTVLISQRSRLMFNFNSEHVKVKVVPQDVRIWGDEKIANTTGVFGDEASLDLHEAFAEIKLFGSSWISVGRQELVYDNMSILSNRNWNQHGMASDAAVLKSDLGGVKMHLGGTWNTFKESNSNNFFLPDRLKTLSFLWLNRKFQNGFNLSAVHLATGITETDTTNALQFRQTTGLYAEYRKKYTALNGNIYYQYGKNQQGVKVSAWMADADISQRFGILTAGLGLGYQSGNRVAPQYRTIDKRFYDIYRAKHKFFGFMDYFTNIPGQTAGGGLADYYWYLDWKMTGKTSLRNTVHYFMLAQTNPATPAEKHLGYENDLILSHRFSPWGMV